MDINQLVDQAAQVNASYRVDADERTLEVGFLYGTAELIIAITGLLPTESYSDKREAIATLIDERAYAHYSALYSVLPNTIGYEVGTR
jgi:hypothetical protein